MPYSAAKVANAFLDLARQEGEEITPLKLIKLVYIAHGWSFVHLPTPLVNENAQAWQYGPVMPSLYTAVRNYRASPITTPIPDNDPQPLAEDARHLINLVWETYGHKSGVQLSNATHRPNTPWSQAWNTHGRNAVIPPESIRHHYYALAGLEAPN